MPNLSFILAFDATKDSPRPGVQDRERQGF
jgi:hypothetical protein